MHAKPYTTISATQRSSKKPSDPVHLDSIVPTLCVGMPQRTLRVRFRWDAERPEMHSHAERGNDQLLGDELGAHVRRIIRQHRFDLALFLQEFRRLTNRLRRAAVQQRRGLLRLGVREG